MKKFNRLIYGQFAAALAMVLILCAAHARSEAGPGPADNPKAQANQSPTDKKGGTNAHASPAGNPADSDTIVVIYPKPGDEVSAPFRFEARIRNPFPDKPLRVDCGLKNADGSTIDYVRNGMWDANMQGAVLYFCPKSDQGIFEVWGDFGKTSVPIKFKKESKAKVYFGNSKSPEYMNGYCSVGAFPVERPGLGKNPTPRAALLELLKGPTKQEAEQGYWSPIAGLRLLHFSVKNGTATVDVDKSFRNLFDKAGLCQQEIIVTPIEATLKQFCNIKEVRILAGGVLMEPQP